MSLSTLHTHRWLLRLAGCCLMLLLVACGSSTAAPQAATPSPTATVTTSGSFPKVYADTGNGLVGLTYLAQGQRITVVGELKAADGTTGAYSATFVEKRTPAGSVRCGGKTYTGPLTEDLQGTIGTIQIGIRNWGLLVLTITHAVGAYQDDHSPPLCSELSGTYRGGLHLEALSGTFTWKETLNLS